MMTRTIKSYSELMSFPTFMERYQYLRIGSKIGEATFGYDRYLNQILYTSREWRRFRDQIIVRDNGCDLGCPDRELRERIIVHHINPITVEDVINRNPMVFDPENVICVSHNTHEAIHYGDEDLLVKNPIERKPNDTCPWRH